MTVHQPYSHPGMANWENPALMRRGSSGAGFFAQVGHGMLWAVLIVAGLAGTGFALYRNDALLAIAQRAGTEKGYLAWEKRVLGVPGWGTPRSVAPAVLANLAPGIDRAVAGSAAPSAPEPSGLAPSAPAAVPGSAPLAPSPAAREPVAPMMNVPAEPLPRTNAEEPKLALKEKSKARKRHARPSSLHAESDARAWNEAEPVRESSKASKPAPVEEVELEEEEAPAPKQRALAKSEPEPERRAAPKAKPEPKTKQSVAAKVALPPPGDDDSPLKAAIRAAIVADGN